MPFVALGNFASGASQIQTSPDAVTWTPSAHPLMKGGFCLAFGNNRFVIVGFDSGGVLSTSLVSLDGGLTWTQHPVPQPLGVAYQSLTYSTVLSRFVAIDNGNGIFANVITSPDGITWTLSATIPQGADTQFYECITSGGPAVLLAVGDDSASHKVVATSPDSIAWTTRLGAGTGKDWNGVTFASGQYVAVTGVSANHQVMTSPDGITWTLQVTPLPRMFWKAITFGGPGPGLYVAVGVTPSNPPLPEIMTSPDGITWTQQTPPVINPLALQSVTFFNGLFVAVGFGTGGRNILTSPDGFIWTLQASAISDNLQAVAGAVSSPPPVTPPARFSFGIGGAGGFGGGGMIGSAMKPCRTTQIDWSSFQRILEAVKPDVVEEVDYPGRQRG